MRRAGDCFTLNRGAVFWGLALSNEKNLRPNGGVIQALQRFFCLS
ncbi:hypothetical protein ACFOEM_06590 [Paenalcaligenes hominis]